LTVKIVELLPFSLSVIGGFETPGINELFYAYGGG
jgi:hypothetical protein